MQLYEMIDKLAAMDPNAVVKYGLHEPHSYRGYYSELAFHPCKSARVGDMLELARSCVGKTFTGYKGGEFTMNAYTDVYIANFGECGDELTNDRFLLWELLAEQALESSMTSSEVVVRLKRENDELQSKLDAVALFAFAQGYNYGHNDTVESAYSDPDENAADWLSEAKFDGSFDEALKEQEG